MALPKYDELYMSVLESLSDGLPHTNLEIANKIAEKENISKEDRQQTLSSGSSVYINRVAWACTYLRKAGLIESVKRGHHRLTTEGKSILSAPPPVLDNNYLSKYPSFQLFRSKNANTTIQKDSNKTTENNISAGETPNDLIEQAVVSINQNLADELLSAIMEKDSDFFEKLVVDLLLKMGYGGSLTDAGHVTQRTKDGGIDGIIREDKLGFDQIYIQAKRWDPEKSVSRPEIQKFSGALQDVGAGKGLFITTAQFSDGAKASAEKQHIVLVDGERLTKLMIEYNVGVSPIARYEIKSIDSDFFNTDIE